MDVVPSVIVFIPGPLRPYCAGRAELPVDAGTVGEALEALERSQPALYRNVCDETGAVRRHLKIERSEKIALVLEADGTVRLKRPGFKKVADIRGAAGELGRNLTWNQMRTLAREDRGTAPRPAAG